jgi:hypothetical protein
VAWTCDSTSSEVLEMAAPGDGIDTDARSSKLTYGIKALIADLYRDDLADKTRRGLEGRVLAGFSAGGLAYGYRSVRVATEDDREIGHRLELNQETAPIVRRIFEAYLGGSSLGGIARQLLKDGVPPPRARTRHRRKGWCASSIRAILHNERYAGVWTYGKKEWVRSPDSGKRRAREQDITKVIQRDRPDLRIVEPKVWNAVQARLKGVHEKYTKREDGGPKGRGIPGKPAQYLLSGLLTCGQCGAPLSIFGSDPRYRAFRCTDHTRRGTCASRVALREAEGREVILKAIVRLLAMPAPAARLRKRAAERCAELEAQRGAGTAPRLSRLDDLNRQIANLVGVLAAGNTSDAIVTALRELEAHAAVERTREEARQVRAPVAPDRPRLPTPDEVVAAVQDLKGLVDSDVSAAREALRRYLAGGRLVVDQTSAGHIVVRGDVLPVGYTEPPDGDSTWTGSVATECSEDSVATTGSGGWI